MMTKDDIALLFLMLIGAIIWFINSIREKFDDKHNIEEFNRTIEIYRNYFSDDPRLWNYYDGMSRRKKIELMKNKINTVKGGR
jgi:hypothetical protein